ncbi:MAG TPA: HAMP domain-containing sensor histidine kinase, partial [Saprospiraceae bacterium]|nr:HAMP domain-containing sensor histidine kinase [Saprospiraceae bacterium]
LHKYARFIKDQAQKLTGQVEKVLQIVKVENDSFRLNKEPLDMVELIDGIVQSYNIKLEETGGELHLSQPDKQVMVKADKMHTSNILGNLLDNAIKYAIDVELMIHIHGQLQGSTYVLTIEDNGPGIPREFHQQVFEKFFRVPTGDLHNVKGFGLGLFYVKSICDQQKWSIDMRSEEGEGTAFIIRMPVIKVQVGEQHAVR